MNENQDQIEPKKRQTSRYLLSEKEHDIIRMRLYECGILKNLEGIIDGGIGRNECTREFYRECDDIIKDGDSVEFESMIGKLVRSVGLGFYFEVEAAVRISKRNNAENIEEIAKTEYAAAVHFARIFRGRNPSAYANAKKDFPECIETLECIINIIRPGLGKGEMSG